MSYYFVKEPEGIIELILQKKGCAIFPVYFILDIYLFCYQ